MTQAESEWWSSGQAAQPRPKMQPWYDKSDQSSSPEDSSCDSSEGANRWDKWQSGETARDKAKQEGTWEDGAPVGRGHGSPYLREVWARRIRNGRKRYEGRPLL